MRMDLLPGDVFTSSSSSHFVAEAFAGAWRVYTSSPLALLRNSVTDIVFPSRIMLPRGDDWRDIRANLNTYVSASPCNTFVRAALAGAEIPIIRRWFLNTILPNTAVEDIYQWEGEFHLHVDAYLAR